MPDYDLIAILGPTASGKTPFAAALAAELHTEIISADSRQIYRGMDLGTGKDLADYTVDGKQIPHHLIDIAAPGYKYNVFEYQRDFLNAYETIKQKGCLPVVCGGTGMYLESVLKGYRLLPVPENPELRTRLADKSLEELTDILKGYKSLHNTTDVDTAKRAIRAIEIEEYYANIGPRQGLGCFFHGPQILGAENIRASLGSHPVQPEVIIQYSPFRLKIAGASLCPPGKIRIYLPV